MLSILTSLVISTDQWLGHPFESGLFSYSIRAGWRYYGMGNEGAALLVGASMIAVGIACDLTRKTNRGRRVFHIALMPIVGDDRAHRPPPLRSLAPTSASRSGV